MTPTERTLKHLKDQGYTTGKTEQWNKFAGPHGIRQDLFGFIDYIAMDGKHVVGVQSCGTSYAEHERKIIEDCREKAVLWLRSGGQIMLIGWRKVLVKRGGKAKVYKPRIRFFELGDFE